MDNPIYALSIQQPWAWLICKGFKDIENRDWRIGRKPGYHDINFKIEIPSRIYVHTGKTGQFDDETMGFISRRLNCKQSDDYHLALPLVFGSIIGEVTITGCVTESESPWFVGKYGFTLTDPVLYDNPIPCRGQLGFFKKIN